MIVLKFGGTSVGTVDSLKNVKMIVERLEEPAIVVVSALGGLTDKLIATASKAASGDRSFHQEMESIIDRHHNIIENVVPEHLQENLLREVDSLLSELNDIYCGLSLIKSLPESTLDNVVSFGERISSLIVAAMIKNASHFNSLEIVKTERWFNKSIADREITTANIRNTFNRKLDGPAVMGGFISTDKETGEITNLGRGGSDYTAALVAAALDADSLEIWTDVDGFMTADPRIIPTATVIPFMTFIESMELCTFGAKVIYPPTIYPVFHKNIPIKILNTFNPEAVGTLINDNAPTPQPTVRGISSIKDASLITISGNATSNFANISSRTFNAMARNGINVFLVARQDAEGNLFFAVRNADAESAVKALDNEFAPELSEKTLDNILLTPDMAILAVVGESIKKINGLGPRLVNTLQRESIHVRAISDGASETTIALVVDQPVMNTALALIHDVCFA